MTNEQEKILKIAKIIDTYGDPAGVLLEHIETTDKRLDDLESIEQIPGPQGEPGEPGYTPVKNKDYFDGKDGESIVGPKGDKGDPGESIVGPVGPKGDAGENGKDGSPDTGEDIVSKINALPIELDKQIDVEHIKGWKEYLLEQIKKLGTGKTVFVGGGSSGGGRIVKAYDISSQLDGVTKTFNLPAMWRVISVHSSSFPNTFRETVDFTWTQQSITFTSEITASSTLAAGQTVTVVYSEA